MHIIPLLTQVELCTRVALPTTHAGQALHAHACTNQPPMRPSSEQAVVQGLGTRVVRWVFCLEMAGNWNSMMMYLKGTLIWVFTEDQARHIKLCDHDVIMKINYYTSWHTLGLSLDDYGSGSYKMAVDCLTIYEVSNFNPSHIRCLFCKVL